MNYLNFGGNYLFESLKISNFKFSELTFPFFLAKEATVDENQVELLSNIHSAEGVTTSLRESAYQQYMSSYYQW